MRAPDRSLSGKKIWVTRPAHQSSNLCRMIEALQGAALRLPTVAIRPVQAGARQLEDEQRLTRADIVVFVSKNAVVHAQGLFPGMVDTLQNKTVLAVGHATAQCLTTQGLNHVTFARDGGGTEALLQLPALSGARIRDKQVLIIRGRGGRETLRDRLTALGADVNYLEVYQRVKPETSRACVENLWHDERPDAVLITSLEGLTNLIEMMPATTHAQLYETPVVVMSERIEQRAMEMGFARVAVAVAGDNSDAGLVNALVNMYEVA